VDNNISGCSLEQTNELFEKIQLLNMEVYNYKKTQLESEIKMKRDKELFEVVRTDRNQAGKELLSSKVFNTFNSGF